MAHHQHVQVLVQRIPGERHRRIGGRREHVRLAAEADDVGRVSTAGPFRMVGVNRAPANGGDRVLDEARFVQRVGVNRNLDVELVGD